MTCPNCKAPLPDGVRVHDGWAGCVASLAAEIAALKANTPGNLESSPAVAEVPRVLAEGWERATVRDWSCTGGHGRCQTPAIWSDGDVEGACGVHAVEMGVFAPPQPAAQVPQAAARVEGWTLRERACGYLHREEVGTCNKGLYQAGPHSPSCDRLNELLADVASEARAAALPDPHDPTWGYGTCRHCKRPLYLRNIAIADGCPCNSGRGINHGIVPAFVCTCKECDPDQTGSARAPAALPAVALAAFRDWQALPSEHRIAKERVLAESGYYSDAVLLRLLRALAGTTP